jgi:hypothetical protein
MSTSLLNHSATDGTSLYSVVSLSAIRSLTASQVDALARIGIRRVSDLLHYRPIHDARLITAAGQGLIAHPADLSDLLDPAQRGRTAKELLSQKPSVLTSMDAETASIFADAFGISTIEQLAAFPPFGEAQRFLTPTSEVFREHASAPIELMPAMIGAVESTATYSSFVKEATLSLKGVELSYDDAMIHYVDLRLARLFPVLGLFRPRAVLQKKHGPFLAAPEPFLHLGYVCKHTQRWINIGTYLGELSYSLALAPGESRNIAVIDWTRSQRTRRSEDTTAREELTNNLFHARALDEVTRSTAREHQEGGTTIAAGTLSTAAANVVGAAVTGGLAGTVPGAAIGGVAGAVVGTIEPGLGNLAGALAGAGAGAVIGFGVGAAIAGGTALVGSGNVQLGTLRSDSSGRRGIRASLEQNITETTSQKASSLRSLRSNIFATDDQAESERLQTRNITNYNHSHMLNIEYFEVLQHYRVDLRLTEAEPLLFLPFRPLDFTFELIRDYWSTLKHGVRSGPLRARFERVIEGATESGLAVPQKLRHVRVQLSTGLPMPGPVQVKLTGQSSVQKQKTVFLLGGVGFFGGPAQAEASFSFDSPGPNLDDLTGLSIAGLLDGQNVAVKVSVQTEDESGRAFRYSVSDDRVRASDGIANMDLNLAANDLGTDAVGEMERYFDERRYFFTRLLLLAIEKEQLIDLVEALQFQTAVRFHFPGIPISTPTHSAIPAFASGQKRVATATLRHLTSELGDKVHTAVSSKVSTRTNALPVSAIVMRTLEAVHSEVAGSPPLKKDSIDDTVARGVEAFKSSLLEAGLSGAEAAEIAKAIKLADLLKGSIGTAVSLPGLIDEPVHLSEFVEPEPIAITGNTLVFRMKKVSDPLVLKKELVNKKLGAVVDHPDAVAKFVTAALAEQPVSHDVYLPTNGVFAEAILGRANASEKIDITRFFNWQDSPIPHLAPAINALTAGSRRAEPLPTDVNIPGNVLNISTPAAFPDPTGMTAVLAAIQNPNLFRDMSKTEALTTILTNLSNLASQQGQLAGTLAGDARRDASQAALAMGQKVADLTALSLKAQQQPSAVQTPTERGGALNQIDKLLRESQEGTAGSVPSTLPPVIADDPRARVAGAPPGVIFASTTTTPFSSTSSASKVMIVGDPLDDSPQSVDLADLLVQHIKDRANVPSSGGVCVDACYQYLVDTLRENNVEILSLSGLDHGFPRIRTHSGGTLPGLSFVKLFYSNPELINWEGLPLSCRGKGPIGALLFADMIAGRAGGITITKDKWPQNMVPGTLLQLWTDEQAFIDVRDKGFTSRMGHAPIFLKYKNDDPTSDTIIVADQYNLSTEYKYPQYGLKYVVAARPAKIELVNT